MGALGCSAIRSIRRLGNGPYLLVYFGCLAAVGLFARIVLPVGLMGASGAIFAVIMIALMLMPAASIESAYVALFPLTLLLGFWNRPKYELNWFLSWGIVAVPAWWCLVLIPLMELLFGRLAMVDFRVGLQLDTGSASAGYRLWHSRRAATSMHESQGVRPQLAYKVVKKCF